MESIAINDFRELPSISDRVSSPQRWLISLSLRASPDAAQAVISTRIGLCAGVVETLALSGISDGGALALGESLTRARGSVRVSDATLDGTRVGDIGARGLAAAMASGAFDACSALRLSFPRLSSAGATAFAHALGSSRLVELDLSGCGGVSAAGAAAIAGALRAPRSSPCALSRLRLDGCGVGDAGAEALAFALLSSIKLLDLRNCGITDRGAAALARALARGALLSDLLLSGNAVGDAGAAALAAGVLARSGALGGPLALELRNARIGGQGVIAFAGALRAAEHRAGGGAHHQTISAIELGDNSVPLDAALTLVATAVTTARMRNSLGVAKQPLIDFSSNAGNGGSGGSGVDGSSGDDSTDDVEAYSNALGVAVSLAAGGSGLDSGGVLSGAARARVLQQVFGGGSGTFVFPAACPSLSALRAAAAEVVRAGFRAAAAGAEMQEGVWQEAAVATAASDVDHSLIMQLVSSRIGVRATPLPEVPTAAATAGASSAALAAAMSKSPRTRPPLRFSVDLSADSDGEGDRMGGTAGSAPTVRPTPVRPTPSPPKASVKEEAAVLVRSVSQLAPPPLPSLPKLSSPPLDPTRRRPSADLSPVSRGLAECLPPGLLDTRIDSLSAQQIAAVLDLARALQRAPVAAAAAAAAVSHPPNVAPVAAASLAAPRSPRARGSAAHSVTLAPPTAPSAFSSASRAAAGPSAQSPLPLPRRSRVGRERKVAAASEEAAANIDRGASGDVSSASKAQLAGSPAVDARPPLSAAPPTAAAAAVPTSTTLKTTPATNGASYAMRALKQPSYVSPLNAGSYARAYAAAHARALPTSRDGSPETV
jgi:hypothetical protein